MIRVFVVDDHTIFRSGLKRLLSDEPDIRVVEEAADGRTLLARLRDHLAIDIVLLDLNIAGRSGLEILGIVRAEFPKLPVLVLSMYPEEHYALTAIRAGANGYASKDIEAGELVKAIRQVAAGQRYLKEAAARRLLTRFEREQNGPPHQRLSAREHHIFLMMVQGMSLTEIGECMYISVKTVSTYRSRILAKVGVENNAELVLYAVRHGIIV